MSTMRRVNSMTDSAPSVCWSLIAACIAIVMLCGCPRTASDPASAPDSAEGSFAHQAELVRADLATQIRVDHSLVRDEDLKVLKGLEAKLLRANLSRTEITDVGLTELCRLTNLEQLRLSSPHVTDTGMANLRNLQKLRFLHLLDAPITDAGLDELHGLTTLESLYLDRTQVTDDGIARLLAALPKVHLHLDDHHHALDPQGRTHQH